MRGLRFYIYYNIYKIYNKYIYKIGWRIAQKEKKRKRKKEKKNLCVLKLVRDMGDTYSYAVTIFS